MKGCAGYARLLAMLLGVKTLPAVLLTWLLVLMMGATASPQDTLGWAANHSYPTTCAEEDNVNIPLFLPGVERYWVIATHPAYCPCPYDDCPPDFSGCPPDDEPGTVTCHKLWDDGVSVVEVCVVSPWWRPYDMEVVVANERLHGHYLRVYRKISGVASFPQVLVLYQDGYLRVKPQPPLGESDVCFGSSVIVGPALPAKRPYVDLQQVEVQPGADSVSLDITYRSGETSRVDFHADREQAIAKVTPDYDTSANTPFAIFRSMWVTDGNADVDTITHASGEFPILSEWETLPGLWWSFWRDVDSVHNRSAPDISVVVDTPAAFRIERERGNVFADGAFHGAGTHVSGADLAEWVAVSEPVEPGHVLEIDPTGIDQYRLAQGPCTVSVAGVVSTQPGMILGHTGDTEGQALLALLGVVPVKVTDEGGPITIGDLIIVSSSPGHAMRWDPDTGQLCGLVGKALEPHEAGEGVIEVLLTQ